MCLAAKFPTREEAHKLLEEAIAYRNSRPYPFPLEGEYRFHTRGVAEAAFKIAACIKGMDSEKAYVFGLLHDYGKRISEKAEHKFHGLEGYEEMMRRGYPEIAQICLTHTFPDKNFKDSEFGYPQEWKKQLHKMLAKIEYNDYDLLIAYCDKFFEGMAMVSLEKRIEGICKRYSLTPQQCTSLRNSCYNLKKYFDEKTGQDTYDILEIK